MFTGARIRVAFFGPVALALAAIVFAAGCSSNSERGSVKSTTTATTSRRLTPDQADELSAVLATDAERGGARFDARLDAGPDATALRFRGSVDYPNGQGEGVLVARAAKGGAAEDTSRHFWRADAVIDEGPKGFAEAMAARGKPGARWTSSPVSPATVAFHRVLAVITGTAAARRDNPQLLQQRSDVAFLQTTHLDDDRGRTTTVDVFRVGNSTYFVDRSTTTLRRLVAKIPNVGALRVDFSHRSPKRITFPDPATIVPRAEVSDLLTRLTHSG